MENEFIENGIRLSVKELIKDKIDKEMEQKVEKFRRSLEDRKDEYISEIMRGIRIVHEINDIEHCVNYKIIFENVYRIEGGK